MEIINYTGKEYTKCKMQNQIFSQIEFPCEVQTKYIEDEGIEEYELPTRQEYITFFNKF